MNFAVETREIILGKEVIQTRRFDTLKTAMAFFKGATTLPTTQAVRLLRVDILQLQTWTRGELK